MSNPVARQSMGMLRCAFEALMRLGRGLGERALPQWAAMAAMASIVAWSAAAVGSTAAARQHESQGGVTGPAFEVASVKLHSVVNGGRAGRDLGANMTRIWRTPGRVTIQAMTALELIELSYGIASGDRIEGKPDWLSQLAFDVIATTSSPSTTAQQNAMLQALLVERFGLKVHRGARPGQVYSLLRGQKVSLIEAKQSEDFEVSRFLPRLIVNNDGSTDIAYSAKHVSVPELADWLSSVLGAPVSDNTGIKGVFDINLLVPGAPARAPGEPETFHRLNPHEFVTAVRSQLGLRLLVQQGPVGTLVIDSIHKPTPN